MDKDRLVIALDGPAGAGKSTVAKGIAKKLNLLYIDTGAMYRAMTYVVLDKKVSVKNEKKINQLFKDVKLEFKKNNKNQIDIYYNDKNINNMLRIRPVDQNVSIVCSYKKVREHMVYWQREISKNYDTVLDGRDIGTKVFPDTPYKFYITASVEKRAQRRLKDRKNIENLSLDEIKKDMIKRDRIDSTRKLDPLKKAKDAILIDTTDMTIEQVIRFILKHIKQIQDKRK